MLNHAFRRGPARFNRPNLGKPTSGRSAALRGVRRRAAALRIGLRHPAPLDSASACADDARSRRTKRDHGHCHECRRERGQHHRLARPRPRRASSCRSTSASTAGTSADASSCSPTSAPSLRRATARRTSSARSSRRRARGGRRRARAHRRPAADHDAHAARRRAAPHGREPTTRSSPAELERVLVRADDPDAHQAAPPPRVGGGLRERRARSPDLRRRARDSRFDDNYAFFRSQILADEAPHIWRGPAEARARRDHARRGRERPADLREPQLHRRAAARPRADPQLRADGALARRAERDRGRVLAADRAEHRRVDRQLLAPLPRHDDRARGRLSPASAACTTRSGTSSPASTSRRCASRGASGRTYSDVYRILLDPSQEPDAEIARQLGYVNTFGRGMYPLVMRAYRDHAQRVDRHETCSSRRSSTSSRSSCAAPSSA